MPLSSNSTEDALPLINTVPYSEEPPSPNTIEITLIGTEKRWVFFNAAAIQPAPIGYSIKQRNQQALELFYK